MRRDLLKFAIQRLDPSSSASSASNRRNTSLERRMQFSRQYDHLKPGTAFYDYPLQVIMKWQGNFQTWNSEATILTGEDRVLPWSSLISLVDTDWAARLIEDPELKNKRLKDIFGRMNVILLQKYPIILRGIDVKRIKRQNDEMPTDLRSKVLKEFKTTQLDQTPWCQGNW